MDEMTTDPSFSTADDTVYLVESVSSQSAFGFVELLSSSRLDSDQSLSEEFSSFEAASDEDLRQFHASLG